MVSTEHYPVSRAAAAARHRWALAVAVAVPVAAWLAARVIPRVEVVGDSMRPTLHPGDRLLLAPRWARRLGGTVRPGDLAAFPDPRQPSRVMVKRVQSVGPEGVWVLGDNPPHSTDSRRFGPVGLERVRGRAVYRYHPPDRRGRLGAGPAAGQEDAGAGGTVGSC